MNFIEERINEVLKQRDNEALYKLWEECNGGLLPTTTQYDLQQLELFYKLRNRQP
jgi:hypothetical protein